MIKEKKATLTKIKTWCPIFTGFYETIFGYDYDQFEGGYEEFSKLPHAKQVKHIAEHENNVGQVYCKEVEKMLNKIGITCKIEFEKVYSPKEYNFKTDSLDVTISFDKKQLFQYLVENKKILAGYFEDTYTSKPGFSSFYNSDIDSWINIYFNQMKEKANILGAILEGIIESQPNFDKADFNLDVYYNL